MLHTMRDYSEELKNRVAYIREKLAEAHAEGIVFGNSGGKDSALVGILCKTACRDVDLTAVKNALTDALGRVTTLNSQALTNINPRLRMTTVYAVAAAENRLVAGTGNRSEIYMGYFTKWGDGSFDFNPIADLTVKEVYEFLRFLGAPDAILTKAPSAGLYDGQTDEKEIGVTYASIDRYLLEGDTDEKDRAVIDRYHSRSEHKRRMPSVYGN